MPQTLFQTVVNLFRICALCHFCKIKNTLTVSFPSHITHNEVCKVFSPLLLVQLAGREGQVESPSSAASELSLTQSSPASVSSHGHPGPGCWLAFTGSSPRRCSGGVGCPQASICRISRLLPHLRVIRLRLFVNPKFTTRFPCFLLDTMTANHGRKYYTALKLGESSNSSAVFFFSFPMF